MPFSVYFLCCMITFISMRIFDFDMVQSLVIALILTILYPNFFIALLIPGVLWFCKECVERLS